MNERAAMLKRRTNQFAIDVVGLLRTLPWGEPADTIKRQLTRSSTSVGANYRAACRAPSRAEFIAKIGIAEEESDESGYWLELITEAKLVKIEAVAPLLKEADELTAIFARSVMTARSS
jgi:four helix bundle protein